VYISGHLDVQLGLAIFVNIYDIRNPDELSTGNFEIYHADKMGVPKAGNRAV